MEFDGHGSSGKTSSSHQSLTRTKKSTKNDAELSCSIIKAKSNLQNVFIEREKTNQAADWSRDDIEKEAGARVAANRSRSVSSVDSPYTFEPLDHRVASGDHSVMTIPACMVSDGIKGQEMIRSLQDKDIKSPVNIATLQELDLHSIQNNLNLRIDVCHDHELFFQPISGQKGDEKRSEAKRYWAALAIELRIYLHDAQGPCADCRRKRPRAGSIFTPRLAGFFNNLREIVQMLVPEGDHEQVTNHLDTALLMQQVQKGVMSAVPLCQWLSQLLTSHCAPMRDSTAAAVIELVQIGTETADMNIFVDGLERLFGLLEGMKLDIANHQIRSFRCPLIEGTVDFQRDHFSRAIETDQIDLTNSQEWYRKACDTHRFKCDSDGKKYVDDSFACFVHGLVQLCNPYERDVPLTLQYDHNRIMRLREDLQDHIQTSLCLAVFNLQVQEVAGPLCDAVSRHDALKQRIIYLTEDEDGNGGAISDHLDAIGIEITRAAFSIRPSDNKTAFPLSNFEFDRTTRSLYKLFRHEDDYQPHTKRYLASLEERTMQFAEQFQKLTALEISNTQKQRAQNRAGKEILLADWDEMAQKLAHIAVIHWRVWEDLCYRASLDFSDIDEQDSPIDVEQSEEHSWDEPVVRRVFVQPISKEYKHRSDRVAAFEESVLVPVLDTFITRHDSGFAESLDDSGYGSAQELDTDLDEDFR